MLCKTAEMACPWQFLFKIKSQKVDLATELDINNNVGKFYQPPSR